MGRKLNLDGDEYEIEYLSDKARTCLSSFQFVNAQIQELTIMQSVLQRAKDSYVNSVKQEVLSVKSGILFGDD